MAERRREGAAALTAADDVRVAEQRDRLGGVPGLAVCAAAALSFFSSGGDAKGAAALADTDVVVDTGGGLGAIARNHPDHEEPAVRERQNVTACQQQHCLGLQENAGT